MFNIENLNDEYFECLNATEVLGIKALSTEDKIKCFKYFLTSDVITNVSVIANVFTLIDGATDIDEDADERLFFNDLSEYVDIKLEIKPELDAFNTRLLENYLGVIEGLDVQLDELKSHIPNTYFNVLHLVTPRLISKLMLKYLPKIDVKGVKPAHCANELYNKIHNQTSLMADFLQSIMSEVKENVNSI